MRRDGKKRFIFGVACIVTIAALASPSQTSGPGLWSAGRGIQLRATLDESLGVVADLMPLDFSLRPHAKAQADHPLIIETRWNLDASRARVELDAFFSRPAGLRATLAESSLSGSDVYVRVASGSAREFTSFAATRGHGVELLQQGLRPGVNDNAERTDTLEVEIDLSKMESVPREDDLGDLTLVVTAY